YAEKVLEVVGGNKSKASELLGISRTSLWRVLKGE
ncbi:MAG: helix-turn-helix domain-containing protein, partial [Nitrospirae bacterium]|nr:helix-turn-helix domain-containing protein [Nitrospirota bacterium]